MSDRVIASAYDAHWFLHGHPAFNHIERIPVESNASLWLDLGMAPPPHIDHTTHALDCNLYVFYAKVDDTGTVNDDPSRNVHVECWLEFGKVEPATPEEQHWGANGLMHYHDPDLDCGAPTFDEALVKLANLALQHYGDYEPAHV